MDVGTKGGALNLPVANEGRYSSYKGQWLRLVLAILTI